MSLATLTVRRNRHVRERLLVPQVLKAGDHVGLEVIPPQAELEEKYIQTYGHIMVFMMTTMMIMMMMTMMMLMMMKFCLLLIVHPVLGSDVSEIQFLALSTTLCYTPQTSLENLN